MSVRYRFAYGWQTYHTTRVQPGTLTHAVVVDCVGEVRHIEWCGSEQLALQEASRVLNAHRKATRGDGPAIYATVCKLLETPL